MLVLVQFDKVVVPERPVVAFLILTSQEGRARCLQLVEQLLVMSQVLNDMLVYMIKLRVVLVLDGHSSRLQLTNNF